MDEAKSLVHMSISAMFAAVILTIAMGLMLLGYFMWSYFSRQDAANQRIKDYATYAAFDNTTVRGQEIIQLIEEHSDDIFVVIYSGKSNVVNNNINIDNMSNIGSPIAYMASTNTNSFIYKYVTSDDNYTQNSIACLDKALQHLKGIGSLNSLAASTPNLYGYASTCNTAKLQECFLTSANNYSLYKPVFVDYSYSPAKVDTDGKCSGPGYYSAFKSCLVYDNDNTTDIVGVIFVQETPNVNAY